MEKPARNLMRHVSYLAGAAFLISALAFYNRYPLVFSDSGTYIISSFTLDPPADRPIGYGLIIRAVTWRATLWTVVLFQSALLSWLLWEMLKKVLPEGADLVRAHFGVVVGLLLFTSVPWYTAQIMPDIFTPMIILVIYLLFRAPELGLIKRGFLWICLFFFLITHNSHVAMAALLFGGMAMLHLLGRRMRWPRFRSNIAGAVAVLVSGILFVTWYNGRHDLGYTFSPTANVFLGARLCEQGMLGNFLDARCGEKDYALCAFKDELPMAPVEFIWSEGSIASRLGGNLVEADHALAPVVHDFFRDPISVGRFLRSSLGASVSQLFQVNAVSGMSPYLEGSAPYGVVARRLPWELSSYATSMQSNGAFWDTSFNNRVVHVAVLLALCVLVWNRATWHANPELRSLIPLLLAWVVINAVITASLANVYDRLQSRVAWLVVLAACLALVQPKACRRLLENPDLRIP